MISFQLPVPFFSRHLIQLATTMANLAVVHDEGRRRPDRAIAFLQESLALHGSVYTFERDSMEETLAEYMDRLQQQSSSSSPSSSVRDGKVRKLPETNAEALGIRSTTLFGNSDGIPNKLSQSAVVDNHDFLLLGPLENEWSPEQRVREIVLSWFGNQFDENDIKVPMGNSAFVSFDESLPRTRSRSKASIPVDLDGDKVIDAELHLTEIHRQVLEHLDHNEIDDALDIFRSALRSHQEKYGEIHPLSGSTLHNIGMVHFFARQYGDAESSFVEAMNIQSAALGASHPDVSSSKMKCALLQLARGDLESSAELFWDIREEFLNAAGNSHPQLAKILNNIGVVAYCRGELEEAYRSFQTAHEHQVRRLREGGSATGAGGGEPGSSDDETDAVLAVATAHTVNNLAFVSSKRGETAQALRLFQEALRAYEEHLPEHASVIATTKGNIRYLESWTGGGMGGHLWNDRGCQIVNPMCFSF